MFIKIALTVVYVCITLYLGYRGWKETTVAKDYLIAGRSMGGFVMALSYGATFISTSAIIGFGGRGSLVRVLTALAYFLEHLRGNLHSIRFLRQQELRRMGLALDAHTFPELIGRRYRSRFLQGFAGVWSSFFSYPFTPARCSSLWHGWWKSISGSTTSWRCSAVPSSLQHTCSPEGSRR